MEQQSGTPALGARVIQGIILGIVLAIPVVFWALGQIEADPAAAGPAVAAQGSKATVRTAGGNKTSTVAKQQHRRAVSAVRAAEPETIPPSQMHLRIDTGARPAASSSGVAQSVEDNDEE